MSTDNDCLNEKPVVCFIHGLACGPFIMQYLAFIIRKKHFSTCFFKYASLTQPFERNVEMLEAYLKNIFYDNIYCVAHSLGGLILLKALERQNCKRIKRVVLLGPPLKGSCYAHHIMQHKIGRLCFGKNAQLWENMPQFFLPQDVEVGIIAGNHSPTFNIFSPDFLEKPNDGIVSVSETHLQGIKDFIVLPVSHIGMLFSRSVGKVVVNFLKHGKFDMRENIMESQHLQVQKWSAEVTQHSHALELEEGVFTWDNPKKIAESLKKSALKSTNRKGTPYQSAMSMLNFYINRAGKNLKPAQKTILLKAKKELYLIFH